MIRIEPGKKAVFERTFAVGHATLQLAGFHKGCALYIDGRRADMAAASRMKISRLAKYLRGLCATRASSSTMGH